MFAAVVIFFSLCFRLGQVPLLQPDEGRNAEVAREMKDSGAWLVPTYNGLDYLDKPAFYFKAVALSLAAFGENETAARIPSAAFGIALVAMAWAFCRRVHGPRVAWFAAAIVATTPLYLGFARLVIFDMALAFFVCGAIFAGYFAELAGGATRRNWYLLGAAAAGFATLVKGPVGMIIPALVLLVFQRIEGRRGAWKRLLAPLNLLVFFGIALPWFVGLCMKHPDFLHYGLVEETFNRFTTAREFKRSEPFYFYALIVMGAFFPWSLALPEASLAAWKRRWAANAADRLCIVWSFVVVIFFSISQSKLPGYILSVAVASGLLVARLFDVASANPSGRAARVVRRATGVFCLICVIVAIAAVLRASHTEELAKPMRVSKEDARQWAAYAMPFALMLTALAAVGFFAVRRRSAGLCLAALALFSPVCAHVNFGAFEVYCAAKSSRSVAAKMPPLPPGTEIASLECYPNGLPFYLGRSFTVITHDASELTSNYIRFWLERQPQWPDSLVRRADFESWIASRKAPVYLIVRRGNQAVLEKLASPSGAEVRQLSYDYYGALLPAGGGS